MSGSSNVPCSEDESEAAEGDELGQGAPALPQPEALKKPRRFSVKNWNLSKTVHLVEEQS